MTCPLPTLQPIHKHPHNHPTTQLHIASTTIPPHLLPADPYDWHTPHTLTWTTNETTILGWGTTIRILLDSADRFTHAHTILTSLLPHSPNAIAFTSFTFDANTPGSRIIIPQLTLHITNNQSRLTAIAPNPHQATQTLHTALEHITNNQHPYPAHTNPNPHDTTNGIPTHTHTPAPDQNTYKHTITQALNHIHSGHIKKVVLARAIDTTLTEKTISPTLRTLRDTQPGCYIFSIDGLFGASPELLAAQHGQHITSRVLAGTRQTSEHSTEELTTSEKDTREHAYAAQSVHDALSQLCTTIHIQGPHPLRLADVTHLATDITGQLHNPTNIITLAEKLHPTAAVCGTPTTQALEIIRELENLDRGRYAGPIGWVDGDGNGELALALRCAQWHSDSTLRLFAGAGIVTGSDPDAELAETTIKLQAVRRAL